MLTKVKSSQVQTLSFCYMCGPKQEQNAAFKGRCTKCSVFVHTQREANLTRDTSYFDLKLHKHILEAPEIYLTSY